MIDMEDLKVLRTNRKTLGIEITSRGEIIVREPKLVTDFDIEKFIKRYSVWIKNHTEKIRKENENLPQLMSEKEKKALYERAKEEIPKRVLYYAPLVGVTYGKISLRFQKTRWGSCSKNGNLSFNCLLMLAPIEVLDSVVVHELCHRKEMNHSSRFYDEVYRVFPNYKKCSLWLKENGRTLIKSIFQ